MTDLDLDDLKLIAVDLSAENAARIGARAAAELSVPEPSGARAARFALSAGALAFATSYLVWAATVAGLL